MAMPMPMPGKSKVPPQFLMHTKGKKKKKKPVNKAARNAAIKARLAAIQGSTPEGKSGAPDAKDAAERAFTAKFGKH